MGNTYIERLKVYTCMEYDKLYNRLEKYTKYHKKLVKTNTASGYQKRYYQRPHGHMNPTYSYQISNQNVWKSHITKTQLPHLNVFINNPSQNDTLLFWWLKGLELSTDQEKKPPNHIHIPITCPATPL